ncbi:hypothetical protein [Desulforegula conservatrix]|uniref:hypothetical protein n=1 Tax=Desulforegula conservatrix TaxID=153026 RepID=UPI0003F5C574|nr:hypothetical protein [Desulforegula conservatrix]
MSKTAAKTTPEETPRPTRTKKTQPECIDLELTKFWRKDLDDHSFRFRDCAKELELAKARLDEANKEYREALRLHNLQLDEVLSSCVDVVLNRLPLAERRFLIKEVSSLARFWSGKGDIVISREALMKFVESLVFYCM